MININLRKVLDYTSITFGELKVTKTNIKVTTTQTHPSWKFIKLIKLTVTIASFITLLRYKFSLNFESFPFANKIVLYITSSRRLLYVASDLTKFFFNIPIIYFSIWFVAVLYSFITYFETILQFLIILILLSVEDFNINYSNKVLN